MKDVGWKVKVKLLSCVPLFGTPWTVACTRLLHPWDFLARVPEWAAISFSRSDPGLPPCRQTLYPLSHQGRYRLRGRLKFKAALALPQAGYYSSGKGRFPVEVLWQWGSRGLGHPSSSEFSMKSEMLPLAPREFPLPFLLWSMNCWG